MYQVGDKFIIEIGGICKEYASSFPDDDRLDKDLYRIKGFNSLVFDEFGLNKLVPLNSDAIKYYAGFNKELNDEAYQRGLNDAWKAAIKISEEEEFGGLPMDVVEDLFGKCDLNTAMSRYTASQAIAKIREYEEKKKSEEETIKVGDELELNDDSQIKVIATCINDDKTFSGLSNDNNVNKIGQTFSTLNLSYWHKTGRHFPEITEMFERMMKGS